MNSRIYTAHAKHARSWPVAHAFSYPVYIYGIDVDELPELGRTLPLFAHNRFGLAAIHDKDYLYPGPGSIREKTTRCLREHGVEASIGRITLITAAKFLGYVFNPVSFFFCYGPGAELVALIAFVSNTFGESHVYVLNHPLPPQEGFDAHFQASKQFHVSPFFDMQGSYDFHVVQPNDRLDVLIQLTKEDGRVFMARLYGEGCELTTASMVRTIGRHPLMAALTMPRILWQAARLYYQKKLGVHHKPHPSNPDTIRFIPPSFSRRWAMNGVLALFQRLQVGRLEVTLPDRQVLTYGGPDAEPSAALEVRDYDFFWRILTRGDTGLGESYMADDWRCDDVTGLLELLIRNWDAICERRQTGSLPARLADYARHLAKANTLPGSRRNIHAHYDLRNEFFKLFLDDSMTYSCGLFLKPDDTLADAQRNKLHAIMDKAEIGPEHHVLEVGCGWGSFAIEAVRRTGCRVTGITVSEEQFALATQRVQDAGLSSRIDIRLCDYRRIEGTYDRIVSIEMLEAVGHANLGTYFASLAQALKPAGRAAIQVITIPDARYARYCRSSDFIRKHIFPGGHLPSLEALTSAVEANTSLAVEQVEDIGRHYATTLRAWRERFLAARHAVRELGFDETFIRKWEYYFCYCEAGFATRIINTLQLVLRSNGA